MRRECWTLVAQHGGWGESVLCAGGLYLASLGILGTLDVARRARLDSVDARGVELLGIRAALLDLLLGRRGGRRGEAVDEARRDGLGRGVLVKRGNGEGDRLRDARHGNCGCDV